MLGQDNVVELPLTQAQKDRSYMGRRIVLNNQMIAELKVLIGPLDRHRSAEEARLRAREHRG